MKTLIFGVFQAVVVCVIVTLFFNFHTVATGNIIVGTVSDKHIEPSVIYTKIGDQNMPIYYDDYVISVKVNDEEKSYTDVKWYKSCNVGDAFKFTEIYNDIFKVTKLKPLGCK